MWSQVMVGIPGDKCSSAGQFDLRCCDHQFSVVVHKSLRMYTSGIIHVDGYGGHDWFPRMSHISHLAPSIEIVQDRRNSNPKRNISISEQRDGKNMEDIFPRVKTSLCNIVVWDERKLRMIKRVNSSENVQFLKNVAYNVSLSSWFYHF